jgi:ribosomal protein S18 acetylase RimI-like enzyme
MGPGLGAIVRLATAADAAATIELWRTAGARPSRTDDVASVRGLLARDPEALIVAEAPEGLVGSVIAGFDGWRANLYRLAVHPDWRRQGLARALVAEAERQLVARGAQRASAIVVEEDDDAVAFWAAVGYRGEAHQARYVKNLFVTP